MSVYTLFCGYKRRKQTSKVPERGQMQGGYLQCKNELKPQQPRHVLFIEA